jgi:hypothetical protein
MKFELNMDWFGFQLEFEFTLNWGTFELDSNYLFEMSWI